jgi:UDP-N-acetylglucosamine transferase subunit ALG13
MILVTVGMHTQPFDRLIRAMDEIASATEEEVVMQIGHATYIPRHARWFRLATGEEMVELYRAARVVVAHGGASAAEILRAGTPLIAVPRLAKYREHIDDHQLDFVEAMERKGLAIGVYDTGKLEQVVLDSSLHSKPTKQDKTLIAALRGYLKTYEAGGKR